MNLISLERLYQRRIRPLIDDKVTYKTRRHAKDHVMVLVTNVCNLSCYSCSALCDYSFGSNPFRDTPYVMPPEMLDEFLSNISDYNPDYWIRLEGGEVSTVPHDTLLKYIEIIHSHGRKVDTLSNGYKLLDYPADLFDYVMLDEHIQNQELIKKIVKYYDNNGYENYLIHPMHHHIDLGLQRKNNTAPGVKCRNWMDRITLYKGVIYPCCMSPFLEGWDNKICQTPALIKAGYTYNNKHLTELINNWEKHIPEEAINTCINGCSRGGKNIRWHRTNETRS